MEPLQSWAAMAVEGPRESLEYPFLVLAVAEERVHGSLVVVLVVHGGLRTGEARRILALPPSRRLAQASSVVEVGVEVQYLTKRVPFLAVAAAG